MAKTTKKTAKKTTKAKKPTAKKTTAKSTAKNPKTAGLKTKGLAAKKTTTARAKAARPELVTAKLTPVKTAGKATRRPPNTPNIPHAALQAVIQNLTFAKNSLDQYAAHLRALDRKRLNKIGNKREGFAQRAYRIAMDNPEFLPRYLTEEDYTEDYDHFTILQTAVVLDKQVSELLKNINSECNDMFYTDGLDFYAAVHEAAKRRVDGAESLYEELKTAFDRKKSADAPETEKQQLRDAKGIIRGTREGKFEAVNIKPKMTSGVHKVVDKQFKQSGKFKEDIEGELEE